MKKVYPEPKAKKENSLLKYSMSAVLMIVILALTLHFLLKGASLEEIRSSLLGAKYRWVAAGFGLMMIHQLCVAEILRLMLVKLVGVMPPYHTCLNTAFIGFYFNNITPSATGGQPMEVYYLYRCRVDIAGASIIFMATTMFYNFVMIVMATVMLIWQHDLIHTSLYGMKYVLIYGYLINGFLMLSCFGLIYFPKALRRFTGRCIGLLKRFKLVKDTHSLQKKSDRFFESYSNTTSQLWRSPKLILQLLLLHTIQLFALYLVPYAAGLALGADSSLFMPTLSLQSVFNLAVSGFPTPGAVGLTESGFVTMFSSVFPDGKVMSAMILTRFINLYAFLVISAVITLFAFARAGSKHSRMRHLGNMRKKEVIVTSNRLPAESEDTSEGK